MGGVLVGFPLILITPVSQLRPTAAISLRMRDNLLHSLIAMRYLCQQQMHMETQKRSQLLLLHPRSQRMQDPFPVNMHEGQGCISAHTITSHPIAAPAELQGSGLL